MLRIKVSEKKVTDPRKRFISSFRKRFKWKSTNFVGKDLVYESEAETEETV